MKLKMMRWVVGSLLMYVALVMGCREMVDTCVPDHMRIFVGQERLFGYRLPVQAEFSGEIKGVVQLNSHPVPSNKISISMNQPFVLSSIKTGTFNLDMKLLGFLYLKDMEIEVINPEDYIPCGNMIGVTVKTDGVMVLGTGNVINYEGKKISPAEGKLTSGDYIKQVNGKEVNTKEDLVVVVQEEGDHPLEIEFERNGRLEKVTIDPIKTTEKGDFKLGIWVRDDTQGIGTLTFVNPVENVFGALGHGITDIDTGQLMELSSGTIVTSIITNITPGKKGNPGEISGVIIDEKEQILAEVEKNTPNGIFGHLTEQGVDKFQEQKTLPIGFKYDIKLGKAYLRSNVDGTLRDYEIMIEKIFLNDAGNKGMIIKVTDSNLLELTNGIVQGMSGSPIIQDNKLIGAVTHVFVQDSTKGYASFIENMILEK